jgi:hypothetical protein
MFHLSLISSVDFECCDEATIESVAMSGLQQKSTSTKLLILTSGPFARSENGSRGNQNGHKFPYR